MTKRRVIYIAEDGSRYVSPEYVGDKTEFNLPSDAAPEMSWFELVEHIWVFVSTPEDFVTANKYAMERYGREFSPDSILKLPVGALLPEADEYLYIRCVRPGKMCLSQEVA